MQRASDLFTEEQRKQVEKAVVEAEAKTSCEVVPVVATASGRYDWQSSGGYDRPLAGGFCSDHGMGDPAQAGERMGQLGRRALLYRIVGNAGRHPGSIYRRCHRRKSDRLAPATVHSSQSDA